MENGQWDMPPHQELYKLDEDIFENHNLADQYPKIIRDMLGLMKARHTPSQHFKFKSQ